MSTILVDGEPVEIKTQPLTVLVHQGEMNIEAPDRVLIGAEQTVACANELEPDQWALIRVEPNFIRFWNALWEPIPPPEDLRKSNLAMRHTVGMILLLVECLSEGKRPFLQLPETYMHPKQQARIINMLMAISPGTFKDSKP